MKYLKVEKDGSITLPREVQKVFPALSELALWYKGDALILKRVSPFRPSEFAERSPKKTPPLSYIVKEIHKTRKG
ncbi:MAG: hypothetical protein QME05_00710 [Candidatus Margulisbacteria bacterium]|nr:hypothetical protein [Candidatus Margulisiibacteriota bacterium]